MTELERKEKIINELKSYLSTHSSDRTIKTTVANVEERLKELTVDDISFIDPITVHEQNAEYIIELHVRKKYSDGSLGSDKIVNAKATYTPNESYYHMKTEEKEQLSKAQYKLIYKYAEDYTIRSINVDNRLQEVREAAKEYFENEFRVELYNNPGVLNPIPVGANILSSKPIIYPKVPVVFTIKSATDQKTLKMVLGYYLLNEERMTFYEIHDTLYPNSKFKAYSEDFASEYLPYKKLFSRKWYI